MAKKTYPKMVEVDFSNGTGVERSMTAAENDAYLSVNIEAAKVIEDHKNAVKAKEAAIAKLVALGLTEEDIRAVMSNG